MFSKHTLYMSTYTDKCLCYYNICKKTSTCSKLTGECQQAPVMVSIHLNVAIPFYKFKIHLLYLHLTICIFQYEIIFSDG